MSNNYMFRVAMNNFERYCRSNDTDIKTAYGRCSAEKERIWERIKKECMEDNGSDLRVVSHNTYHFTAAYMYENNGKLWFRYIVPTWSIRIECPWLS